MTHRALVALVAFTAILAGCSGAAPDDATPAVSGVGPAGAGTVSTTTAPEPSTTGPSATTAPGDPPPTTGPGGPPPTSAAPPAVATAAGVRATKVALSPIATANAPLMLAPRTGTDTLYVAERAGRVRALAANGTLGPPILDISADVTTDFEKGLLGLAFSPDGARLYASYTDQGSNTRLDEFTMRGDVVDVASRRIVLQVKQPAGNHNGGNVAFGPDGFLWLGLGDGGGSGDQFNNAQNLDTLLGAVLRIDPSGRQAGNYSIPADNPFAGGGGRPEIWLYGVRNPWRWSFDRATGDLWIGDVGQNTYEEIDRLAAPARGRGANLQWPLREGNHKFRGDAPANSVDPVFEYDRSNGSCSVTGGFVYRGKAIKGLAGAYLYGDYCEGTIFALVPKGDAWERVSLGISPGKSTLVSFAQDNAGELYTLSLSGAIAKLVAP